MGALRGECNGSVFMLICLISIFVTASVLLLSLRRDFMALAFIVVYIGALAVLFLFVIMMLGTKTNRFGEKRVYTPFGVPVGCVFFFLKQHRIFLTTGS